MSEHYISCARCDKDIVIKTSNDCYSSEIDGQLVCRECWQKEQPKFLSNKIADLEAKLAESEIRNEQLVEALNGEVFINYKVPMENAQLKQQLAEKEKENLTLREKYIGLINMNVKEFDKLEKEIDKHNQDKIEFAIAELEKVYKTLTTEEVWRAMKRSWLWNGECKQLRELIDNQIKQLKETIQ